METRCQTGQNFRGMKLSRMAADPRKPRKFNPAKVKAYTVFELVAGIGYISGSNLLLKDQKV